MVSLWERKYQKFVSDELGELSKPAENDNSKGTSSRDVTGQGVHATNPIGTSAPRRPNDQSNAAAPGPATSKVSRQNTHEATTTPSDHTRMLAQGQEILDSNRTNTSAMARAAPAPTSAPHRRQLNRSASIPAADEEGSSAQKNVSTTATTTATTPRGQTHPAVTLKRATGAPTNKGQGESTAPTAVRRQGSGSVLANGSRDSSGPVVPTPFDSASTTAAGRTSTAKAAVQRQVSGSTPKNTSEGGTARPSPPASKKPTRRAGP